MDKFVASVKKKYRERLLNCEEQWPPVSVEKLVNLYLVEAEKKEGFRAGLPQHGAPDDKVKHTPILHCDLFKVEEGKKPVRKLIVEGNAGIGKTTLCTMLTEEWANGKIFTQFDCVLLLPLRERSVSTATTLPQLFKLFHSSERIRTSVIEELEEREGEGVLIIADGWDELDQENRSNNSFLRTFLFGSILPFLSVLLTSRPSASAPLHNLCIVDRLVEVLGFTEENVKQYVKAEFEKCLKKALSLIEQLKNNPLIMSLCSVPLNCAIICNLWHTQNGVFPKTLTELYAEIVLTIILRNHRKTFSSSLISLSSFDSIPDALQGKFWLVCKLAFECLSQDKIVFSVDELDPFFPRLLNSSDELLCLGLLQCARSLLPVGQGLSLHFVHLTIQEFLAALHLVTLPKEEKLEVCDAFAKSSRFSMVWRFVFGLGCQQERYYSRKVVCLEDEVVDRLFSMKGYDINDRDDDKQRLVLCHCAMESSNEFICLKAAEQLNERFVGFSPLDCVAVFHCLRHCLSSHFSHVEIVLAQSGLTDKLLKELTDILSSTVSKIQVEKLFLRGNKVTDRGIADLLYRASASFFSLELLSFSYAQSSNGFDDIVPLLSSLHSLKRLSLSGSPLGVSGVQSLGTAVQAGVLVNLELLYLSNTLTDDADINGALLATLLPLIASHCPNLLSLNLSNNNLGLPGASAVGELIASYNRGKLFLNLSSANINTKAVATLIVPTKCTEPSCVCELNLSKNPLGYKGLLAIFRKLKSRASPLIAELDLSSIYLTLPTNTKSQHHSFLLPNIGNTLNLGLSFESKLTVLVLYDNNFGGNNVLMLAECVRVCSSLVNLHSWSCSLSSIEVLVIFDHLRSSNGSHKNLKVWDLSDNFIDDKGVNALIESVPDLFPSLEDAYLDGNPVSGKGDKRLRKTLLKGDHSFQRNELERLAADEEVGRSAVLTEWKRTCSPPQNIEVLNKFKEIWRELLDELVWEFQYQIEFEMDVHHVLTSLAPSSLESSCEDSTTEDSPAPPSDDESFHSATEELDEPVGPPPTATDESTTVQSPHRMAPLYTCAVGSDVIAGSPSQTIATPSSHNTYTLSAIPELNLSVLDRELKTLTKPIQFGIKLGIPQYRIEIIQQDHHHDTEGQKIALFQYIAKNHKSVGITWSSIADALRDIHAGDLSLRIREQYCSPEDGTADNTFYSLTTSRT